MIGSEPEELKEHTIEDVTQSRYMLEEVLSSGKEDTLTIPRSVHPIFE